MKRRSYHHRASRSPSPEWPMVFYAGGHWLRSGHPSRYDAWPVMAAYQPTWQQALCVQSGMAPRYQGQRQ